MKNISKEELKKLMSDVDEELISIERKHFKTRGEKEELIKQWNKDNVCVVFLINPGIYSKPTWIPTSWMPEVRIPVQEDLTVEIFKPEGSAMSRGKYLLYEYRGKRFNDVTDELILARRHSPFKWEYPVLELNLGRSSL